MNTLTITRQEAIEWVTAIRKATVTGYHKRPAIAALMDEAYKLTGRFLNKLECGLAPDYYTVPKTRCAGFECMEAIQLCSTIDMLASFNAQFFERRRAA